MMTHARLKLKKLYVLLLGVSIHNVELDIWLVLGESIQDIQGFFLAPKLSDRKKGLFRPFFVDLNTRFFSVIFCQHISAGFHRRNN